MELSIFGKRVFIESDILKSESISGRVTCLFLLVNVESINSITNGNNSKLDFFERVYKHKGLDFINICYFWYSSYEIGFYCF